VQPLKLLVQSERAGQAPRRLAPDGWSTLPGPLACARFALRQCCNQITETITLHGDMLPEQCAGQFRFSGQDGFDDSRMLAV
jgi:hypothetical protein